MSHSADRGSPHPSTPDHDSGSAPPRLFGTDGIRARFGDAPLDEPTVRRIGFSLARYLCAQNEQKHPGASTETVVVVGGDTRASTETLARWLGHGLQAGGARMVWVGVIPTPGVAWITRQHQQADAGVAVSASHNPAPDNGLKLLSADGSKWDLEREHQLEALIHRLEAPEPPAEFHPTVRDDLVATYVEALRSSIATDDEARPLAGFRIALDTSHGAASKIAQPLFESLGARVVVRADQPNGHNINDGCGSTHPEPLAELVKSSGSHLGIAFDGDADRAILIDERGEVRDGDAILYLWSVELQARNELSPARIVATTMSNLGLEVALRARGIELVRCGVGDRTLVETLLRESLQLGGEQSGHIVHLGLSTTGDGLLTALQLAAICARANQPISQLLTDFKRYPQLLLNVPVRDKPPFESLAPVAEMEQSVEHELGDHGRLVLRYSGTEPLARVMIEGEDAELIDRLAHELAGTIASTIGV